MRAINRVMQSIDKKGLALIRFIEVIPDELSVTRHGS